MKNDKVLPQRTDTERELLGAALVDESGDAFRAVASLLSSSDFFNSLHRKIFVAMEKLVAAGKPMDVLLLGDALADDAEINGAGGVGFIASLSTLVHRKAPVDEWAKIIRDAAIKRSLIYKIEELERAAYDPQAQVVDLANFADALSSSVNSSVAGNGLGILASDIAPENITWLWPGRIPLGKITVLDGDPGLGKSAVTLDLAARITTGNPMPDGAIGKAGGVLVLNAEDGSADTIVPRLTAMGALLNRVRILKTIHRPEGERQPEIPRDLVAIERAAESVKAKLIVVDPLMAFLSPETNSFRDQDVRRALAPLTLMAERLGAAVLIVRHLNKNSEGNPIYRGGGSIGIISAARAGLLVALDPDDESHQSRILAVTKTNLGPGSPSLRWSIQPDDRGVPRVHWSGESTHQASTLLALPGGEEGRTESGEAGDYLLAVLEDGPLPANEVLRKGKAAGFSERTLKRAKAQIGIKRLKQGFGAGAIWLWKLPAKDAKSAVNSANNPELAPFAQATDSKPAESGTSPKDAKDAGMASFDKNAAPFASGNGAGGRVRVVSWNLPEEPIHIEGVGSVTNPTRFANLILQQLRGALEHPKRKMAWSVSQLIEQLSQVGVDVELSD